jgi:surface polysaccharide O-acyltransferase-like enzyme
MALIQHKEFSQIQKMLGANIYGYIGAMLIIALVGMIIQFAIKPEEEEKKEVSVVEPPKEDPK